MAVKSVIKMGNKQLATPSLPVTDFFNDEIKKIIIDMKNTMKEMEETETELVNKMITQETIKRQQEILTKLLDYEKAEKEREQDNKRESKEGKNEANRNQNQFLEYNKQKQKEAELLKTLPPSLAPYYKNKVNVYFNNFDK